MTFVPEHLISENERILKIKSRRSEKFLDNFYYKLEGEYIFPLFKKSEKVIKIAKELSSCESEKEFKIKFENFALNLFEKNNLLIKEPVRLKYTVSASKNIYKSYFSISKNSIFINKKTLSSAYKNKEKSISLIYTLMHEMAHAMEHRIFDSIGHDNIFHFCLVQLFKNITEINSNKIYRNKISHNGYIESFDKDSAEIYFSFLRSTKKQIRKIKSFDNIENSINFINKKYKLKINESTLYEINDVTKEIEIEVKDSYYGVIYYFTKTNIGVDVYVFDSNNYIQYYEKKYIDLLQSKYEIKRKKLKWIKKTIQ